MWVDFLIGFFAVNALPHYLFGRMNSGVLGLFGFGPRANVAYAIFCLSVSVCLFLTQHSVTDWRNHMTFLGALTIVVAYLLTWDFIDRFLRRSASPDSPG